MKTEERSFEVVSTMQGEKITMGIRVEDMAHIMSIMTDLYKNRLLAVIREYSTNALDAHVEAGVSLPIEITLPSNLDPTLKIRDYGTGLDTKDIEEVYSQYGRSTKRDTNDQVGMLGLGCKSALTYGNQFTVTSVKDGKRISVLISREEDGAGTMMPLGDPIDTDEANGTEVMVAIQRGDIGRARDLAADFFQYWKEGAVLLNGTPAARFEGLKLSDSMWLKEGQREDVIVMGNVAYPATLPIQQGYPARQFHLIVYTPIGTVKPTPSREALMDTKMTNDTLAKVTVEFKTNMKGAIQREADKADSPQAAIAAIARWKPYLGNGTRYSDYTYKSLSIPEGYKIAAPKTYDDTTAPPPMLSVPFRDGYYKKATAHEARDIRVETWPSVIWVANFAPDKFNAQHKNKMRKWCAENNIGQDGSIHNFILLRTKAPDSKFIDPALIVEWEVIKKIKLDPKPRYTSAGGPTRIPGSYDLYTENGFKSEVKGSDIRTNEPLFYVHGNQYQGGMVIGALKLLHKKFTLVCLGANRIEKFKRDASMVKEVHAELRAGHKTWKAGLDKDDLLAYAMQTQGNPGSYSWMDPTKVLDPELKEAIRLATKDIQSLRAAADSFRQVENPRYLAQSIKPAAPLSKYPLASRHNPDHTYCYLNAAYKEGLVK